MNGRKGSTCLGSKCPYAETTKKRLLVYETPLSPHSTVKSSLLYTKYQILMNILQTDGCKRFRDWSESKAWNWMKRIKIFRSIEDPKYGQRKETTPKVCVKSPTGAFISLCNGGSPPSLQKSTPNFWCLKCCKTKTQRCAELFTRIVLWIICQKSNNYLWI